MMNVTITYDDRALMLITGVLAITYEASRSVLYLRTKHTATVWDTDHVISVQVRTIGGFK